MKTARSLFLAAVVALSVFVTSIQQAHAVLPVLVYAVARQAVYMTAEAVTIGVIAKGFAANDPYVRTTATLPRSTLARNISKLRGPRWAGLLALLATVAGLGWEYDEDVGLYTTERTVPNDGVCESDRSQVGPDACLHAGMRLNPYAKSVYPLYVQQTYVSPFVFTLEWCLDPVPLVSASCNAAGTGYVARYKYTQLEDTISKQHVTEKDINEKLLPAIVASPNTIGDMFAGATEQQLVTLLDGATIPYNPTNPTPEMEQLKADYRNGLLQAVDPAAPHYVTPDLLKQIQDLVGAEDAAQTDDGTVDALNKKMKQPITQAQYEESNKKFSDAVESLTSTLPNNDSDIQTIDDSFNKLDGIITDLPNTSLPAPADISVPQYVDCQQIHLTDGNGHDLDFPSPSQCAKIETFKQGFGYFLAVSVVFLLGMQLLTRPHG